MIAKPGMDREPGSSPARTEMLIEILIDSRPDVTPLAPDAAARVFENVLREISASAASRRTRTGVRLALSVAFCVGAAAGMLLLRSVASETSARPHFVSNQIAAPAHNSGLAVCVPKGMSPVYARRPLSSETAHSLTRTTIRILGDGEPEPRSNCGAPPAPIGGMTTFAIFTPLPDRVPRMPQYEGDDPEDGSLLICVVSNDDRGDTRGMSPSLDGNDIYKPNVFELRPSCVMLSPLDSLATLFTIENGPLCSWNSMPILAGADCSGSLVPKLETGNDGFVSRNTVASCVLALPDYNSI